MLGLFGRGKRVGTMSSYADRTAARQALSGDLGAAANKFFKGASGPKAKTPSTNFASTKLPGGAQRLEFYTPARNSGYGKRYVQELDSAGNKLRHYKETFGPEGLIETKWLVGGPK